VKNLTLLLFVFVSACAGEVPDTQTARSVLNHMAAALNQLKPALIAMCSTEPTPVQCIDAVAGFNEVAADHKLAQDALDVVEQVQP